MILPDWIQKIIDRLFRKDNGSSSGRASGGGDSSLVLSTDDMDPARLVEVMVRHTKAGGSAQDFVKEFDRVSKIQIAENRKQREVEVRQRDKILAPLRAQIKTVERNAVVMKICPERGGIRCGASKVGGTPDVPEGFAWPQHEDEPMGFLAQIDLAEVAALGSFPELPSTGWLLFFHCFDNPDGREVRHVEAEPGALLRSVAPAGVQNHYHARALELSAHASLPSSSSDFAEEAGFSEEQASAFYDLSGSMPCGDGQLLGYAMDIQGPMEMECELAARGLSYSDPSADDPAVMQAAQSWRLLLQLASDSEVDFHWGDDGWLYFFIREADLQARNFDRVHAIIQCG